MSVQSAALHKAITSIWVSSGLDSGFKQYWTAANKLRYPSLHDGEAAPGNPFPYCVFETGGGPVTTRMSGPDGGKYQIRDIPWVFHVFTESTADRSAKEYAAYLAESIMFFFGGHPGPVKPQDLVLDVGQVLLFQFQADYGTRVGDNEYQWTVEYLARVDQFELV